MKAYVVWIEMDRAKVFELKEGKKDPKMMRRGEVRHHRSNEPEKRKNTDKFFAKVADRIKDADELLLIGPGLAKDHFRTFLKTHHREGLASAIVGLKTSDHINNGRVLKKAREFFKQFDLFGQEPPRWTVAALVLALFAPLSLPFTPAARASTPQWQEIPVQKVFVAEYGFDDNDNVELVADGVLPNACYSIGPGRWQANAATKTITYRQYAHRELTGPCVMTSALPPALKRPIPFTVETSLGRLPAANYGVRYQQTPSVTSERRLTVARATSMTVDSLPYAHVTGIELADYVRVDNQVTAYLTGILTNTCSQLNPVVQILNEGDVLVALPTLKYDLGQGRDCADLTVPFRIPVNLGKPATGRYLLHVRSMSGKALNKVFSVFSDS